MNLLSIALLSPSHWTVIGAPLGNHLWQSTVFAGAVCLLTFLLRKNQARSRYVLWLIASAKFLIPFSLLVGLGSHLPSSRTPAVTQPVVFLAMETLSEPFAPVNPTRVTPPSALGALDVAAHRLPALLLVVWSAGCFAVLLVWYVRWRRLHSARRSALRLSSGREIEALRRMEQTARVPQKIDLLLSKSALEPGILGIFRPALLLPAGISEKLTDPQLESVIAHELCHVRRRDNLAAAFHMLVEALFWFHPMVWWMGARLVEERERACDEEVLRLGADPHVYAEGILKLCKFYLESPQLCAAGVTGSNLKKRIEAIMSNRIAPNLDWSKKLLLSTMGVVAIIGPVVFGLLHVTQSKAQTQSVPSLALAFDSVSIKLNTTGEPMAGFVVKGRPMRAVLFKPDRFMATNFTLRGLIQLAYRVPESQILGPDWVSSEKYDVEAKLGSSAAEALAALNKDQSSMEKGKMLQALLADHFELTVHRETKDVPAYVLVIAKNSPKLHPAKAGDTYPDGLKKQDGSPLGADVLLYPEEGKLVGQGVLIAELVKELTGQLGRPVIDETGLKGNYDFTLDCHADFADRACSLTTVLPEQLGLELNPKTAPVDVLIIDHAERIAGGEAGLAPPQVQSTEKSQALTTPASSKGSFSCTFDSVKYPEGTIIQEANGPEQLCAQVQDRVKVNESGQAQHTVEWIHTSPAIRERGKDIVHLPVRPIAFCTPKPSTQNNLCSCQESGDFSTGSNVDSANGKLNCKKGKWVPLGSAQANQATTKVPAAAAR